jgi:hypothetical protein
LNSQNQPLQRLTTRLHSRITELGHNMPKEWSHLYAQLFEEYLLNTLEGKEYIVDLFKLDWSTGESDQEYRIADTNLIVPGEEIYFLKAAVVRGQFVPPTHIDEYQIITERCDKCNIFVHCFIEINGEKICSSCINYLDEYKHLADRRCPKCTITKCPNHPLHMPY